MGFFALFKAPKPAPPPIVIRNVIGEEIDRIVGVWNLENADLRGRQWQHADLSNRSLDGSNLSGSNLLGANLRGTSLRYCTLIGCEISYADASGCDFSGSDMVGCLLYRSETQNAKFHNILLSKASDIPKIKVFQTTRVNG